MRFLIDTHCWLWAVGAPERLRPAAREAIESRENTVLFSAVSALEIAIKVSLGKLRLPNPLAEFVRSYVDALSMTSLPVYQTHALQVAELPRHHRDPFDRLLVAQCQVENVPLMTADAALAAYDLELLWAGRDRPPRRSRR